MHGTDALAWLLCTLEYTAPLTLTRLTANFMVLDIVNCPPDAFRRVATLDPSFSVTM